MRLLGRAVGVLGRRARLYVIPRWPVRGRAAVCALSNGHACVFVEAISPPLMSQVPLENSGIAISSGLEVTSHTMPKAS